MATPPPPLLTFQQLEHWQQDNDYIKTHYRPAEYSYPASLRSIFSLHNETINIWTHGLGALAFLIILLAFLHQAPSYYPTVTRADLAAVSTLFITTIVCFSCSTVFHTLVDHSPRARNFTSRLDHPGIVLVIWGSTVPLVYFGFQCHPHLRLRYSALATTLALASVYAVLHPRFRTLEGRRLRAILFTGLGLSAILPSVHAVMLYGWTTQKRAMGLDYLGGLAVMDIGAAVVYALRVPERWWPEQFDVLGSSHQLMHLLVMGGGVSHSVGLVKALGYWCDFREVGGVCGA